MKTHLYIPILGGLALVAGCASTLPPTELVNARAAYTRASTGETAQLNPADLHVAKQTLDDAERSFAEDGASQKTKDAAYTAERREPAPSRRPARRGRSRRKRAQIRRRR